MMSFIVETQFATKELKIFLEIDSLDNIKEKLDKFYIIMILNALKPDFDHVRHQILIGLKVLFMENLTTRLLRVQFLRVEIFRKLLSLLP